MDQEKCTSSIEIGPSQGGSGRGGRGPLVMKRRSLALATAAMLASASSTSAFSPSRGDSLSSCHAIQQSPLFLKDRNQPMRSSSQRGLGSLQVLNMVSFLEAPTTTSAAIPPQHHKRKRVAAVRSPTRVRKATPREGRTIEIELQPDYDILGMDDFVTSSSSLQRNGNGGGSAPLSNNNGEARMSELKHGSTPELEVPGAQADWTVPAIDSEILYEGITNNAQSQTASATTKNSQARTTSTLQKVPQKKSQTVAAAEKQTVKSTTKSKPGRKKEPTSSGGSKKNVTKSKSSTMPGFIKDDQLDSHIANLGLTRLPSSQRKLTRMVRSKTAKMKRRQTNSEMMYKKSPSVPDSLVDYAQEIHAISRVTPKEEKELGTKTQEAMRLQRLHDDLQAKYGRDPTDDEWCAAAGKMNVVALREAMEDGMEAKNQLVASNLRMVQRVVNLYIRNGLGSEYNAGDLMQDGTMALIRAAEKYEPDRGFRFSTYAMYWIRSAVKRSQTSQSRIVTVPQRIHETHKRVSKNTTRLRKELGREPTKDELAEACDITVLQLDRCHKAMQQVTFSLDAEVQNNYKPNNSNSRRDTMYDIVEGKVDETEYERTQRLLMKEHLIGTLKRYLSPHEVDLLLLRYGLMDERALPKGMSGPLTIAEVSKLVGLKPDKVRRIIINSQKQLRHLMKEWEDFEYELA